MRAMPDTAFDPLTSATVLTLARLGRTARPLNLPLPLRPQNAAQAYAVQDAVVRQRGPVAGWKVGAASPQALAARAALTADSLWVTATDEDGQAWRTAPLAGDAQPSMDDSGPHQALRAAGYAVLGVEAELAYGLAADLPPRATPYSEAEVLAAVHSVRAAIELCDTRYAAWALQDEWCRLADQACHGALIVGTGTSAVAAVRPLAQGVRLWVNGQIAVQHAQWGNPAGDPVRLLAWLANEGALGLGGLRAGQWVTTGSCTGTVMVAPGSVVVAEFPGLGRAQLRLE
jgi:2-keto-4-pentenoate hydratase